MKKAVIAASIGAVVVVGGVFAASQISQDGKKWQSYFDDRRLDQEEKNEKDPGDYEGDDYEFMGFDGTYSGYWTIPESGLTVLVEIQLSHGSFAEQVTLERLITSSVIGTAGTSTVFLTLVGNVDDDGNISGKATGQGVNAGPEIAGTLNVTGTLSGNIVDDTMRLNYDLMTIINIPQAGEVPQSSAGVIELSKQTI